MRLNPLVHEVIWPAVAGSILWTFLQVAIDPQNTGSLPVHRLAALLLVGVYLAIDWVDTHQATDINENYWVADMPLAASLSTFAVATQFDTPWAAWPLAVALVTAVIGHGVGAWDLDKHPTSRRARGVYAGVNAAGLVVLVAGSFTKDPYRPWRTAAAIGLVITLYLLVRKKASTW